MTGGVTSRSGPSYWLTRFAFLRMLGLVYTVAFAIVVLQWQPLLGSHGLLPVSRFLEEVGNAYGGGADAFLHLPTLFWLDSSDAMFRVCALAGLVLSLGLLLGLANVPMLALLWLLYLSFAHVGQIFWGYGWDILLLETGFLAIFLVPLWRPGPFPRAAPPSRVGIVLLRWLTLRLMLGAGLIKLRGDPCWRDLTCLVFHYETQPNPNPLSWYFFQLPVWFHQLEVLVNHLVELVAPLFVFGPRRARLCAGVAIIAFQSLLILSGNLSFLNWLTIAVAIGCLDDGVLRPLVPARGLARLDAALAGARESRGQRVVGWALAAGVALLSVGPATNLISPSQMMNASFDPFDLVNTYGAFGSVTRQRFEIVLEGTADDPASPAARWVEYEFRCKPGAPSRPPVLDLAVPRAPRLADVVPRDAGRRNGRVVHRARGEAARGRPGRARSARAGRVRDGAAARDPGPVLGVPLHPLGRAHGGLVAAQARRGVPPADHARGCEAVHRDRRERPVGSGSKPLGATER